MHEIILATYEIIDELDRSELIKNLVYYKNRVKSNIELCDLIDKGRGSDDKYLVMDIKRRLYSNSDYKNYIDYYNQLFYIVMDINNRFNKIINNKGCSR